MKYYIMIAAYSILDMLKYFLCMLFVFDVPMMRRKKVVVPVVILVTVFISVLYFRYLGTTGIFYVIPNILAISLVTIIKKGCRLRGILFILLSCIIMDSLTEIVRQIFVLVSKEETALFGKFSVYAIDVKIIVIVLLLAYHFIINVFIQKKVTYIFHPLQWAVIFTCFVGIMMIIPALEKMSVGLEVSTETHMIMCVSMTFILFLFLGVMVWLSYIVRKNIDMQERELRYRYLMKSQSVYFDNITKNYEEIRMFRHDIRAHITAIRELTEGYHDSALRDYLNNMEIKVNTTKAVRYTGNKAVDAVINELVAQMKPANTEFKFDGLLRHRDDVSDFDLCVIFYNVIQNAIEASLKVEESARKIFVKVKMIGDKIGVQISNNTDLTSLPSDEERFTTKEDKENHGYGNLNVKDVVDKYDGIYVTEIDNGQYVVDIII
ncbi:MAG: GHKL domain-containing protein [Eubacterium sp.]|nr:GHKL domain-containing protein [Eubacterium sp.]